MFLFIVRRLLIAIPILILSSVLVFVLVVNAGDPLENLRSLPNSAQLIEQKTAAYHLDQPVVQRYLTWAKGVLHGDFGKDATGQESAAKLRALSGSPCGWSSPPIDRGGAGHHRGGISAIQYTLFDYGATFLAFLFFAMPVFWFAVCSKRVRRHQAEQLARAPGPLRPGCRHRRRHLRRAGVHHLQHRREALRKRGLMARGRRCSASPRRPAGHLVRWPHLPRASHHRARVAQLHRVVLRPHRRRGPHDPADHPRRHQLRHLQPVPAGVAARHAVVRTTCAPPAPRACPTSGSSSATSAPPSSRSSPSWPSTSASCWAARSSRRRSSSGGMGTLNADTCGTSTPTRPWPASWSRPRW